MRVIVKKLYLDKYVSVRDYLVEKAKAKNEPLLIYHDGLTMTVTDYSKGYKDPKQQYSKFDKRYYHLIDFKWHPDKPKKKDLNQVEMEF